MDSGVAEAPLCVDVADLNGDGGEDLVVANSGFDCVTVLLNSSMATDAAISMSPSQPMLSSWPNPFNPRATIRYTVTRGDRMKVRVYSSSGRLITTLVDDVRPAGVHLTTWDGCDSAGRSVGSGVYFVRFESSGTTASMKLVLAR